VGNYSSSIEGLYSFTIRNFSTKNIFIPSLKFYPYLRTPLIPALAIKGEGGYINISDKAAASEVSIALPPLIGKADLEGIKLIFKKGELSLESPYSFLHYEFGSIVTGGEKATLNLGDVKFFGAFQVRVDSEGNIKEFSFASKDINLNGYGKGEVLLFSFSLNTSSISPLFSGKIEGTGTIREGILRISVKAKNLRIFKGEVSTIRINLERGKRLRGRLETSNGDLIFLRGNKLRITRLNPSTIEKITGFPHLTDSFFSGNGKYSSNELEFHLKNETDGNQSISTSIGKESISVRGRNLKIANSIVNFSYKQTGKSGKIFFDSRSEKLEDLSEKGKKVYKYFIKKDLFLPEITGKGKIQFSYNFSGKNYEGNGIFFMERGKLYGYKIGNLKATWKDSPALLSFSGNYSWDRGTGSFSGISSEGKGTIKYKAEGFIEDILEAVESDFDLQGKFTTDGTLSYEGEKIYTTGKGILSKGLVLSRFIIKNVQGNYNWDGWNFNMNFFGKSYNGLLRGSLMSNPKAGNFEADVEGFRLKEMVNGLMGKGFLHIISNTEGEFTTTTLSGRIEDFGYLDEIKGKIDFNGLIKGDKKPSLFIYSRLSGEASCNLKINGKGEDTIFGTISAHCDSAGALLPWPGSRMKINGKGDFALGRKTLDYKIDINARGKSLTLFDYPQPIKDFSLELFLGNKNIEIKNLKGTLGEGNIRGEGKIFLTAPLKVSSNFYFTKCKLYPFKGVEGLGSGELIIKSYEGGIRIGGEITFSDGKWEREFEEPLEFSSRPSGKIPTWANFISLNVAINSERGIKVKNSWGEFEVFPDFRLVGPAIEPGLIGEATLGEGYMWAGERKFFIKRGKIYLSQTSEFDPYLDIETETIIKNFRVEMKINGLLSHAHISLSSSPPLPTHELFSLLAMGESFKRGISRGLAYQLAPSSLLSQTLTGKIGKGAKSFLGLSRLSVSPYILPGTTEPLARLTVEKQVGKNFTVVYSTNLSSVRQEVVILEYRINPNLYLVMMRDERNNYILDIKYYPTFR